jgi:predicted outer membrane repeat protein
MKRKEFFKTAGKVGFGACLCGAAGGLGKALAGIQEQAQPGDKTPERAVKRMEFADIWIKRFFDVMDKTLDEASRAKLMMLNGKTCYREWIVETKQEIKPIAYEEWAKKAATRKDEGFKVEGNVIYFQYNSSAETGGAVEGGVCLCPMVETLPAGMSPTYCHCSVGYVKEMFELRFNRTVSVELLDSVLKGGKRCKFKITVV